MFLTLLGLCVLTLANNFNEEFAKGFTVLTREGRETSELRSALAGIKFPQLFRGNYIENVKGTSDHILCTICNHTLDILITSLKNGLNPDLLFNAVKYLCIKLDIESAEVCDGLIDIHKDIIIYVVTDNESKATPEKICATVFQKYKCPDTSDPWHIEIPAPIEKKESSVSRKRNSKKNSIKVVHISDLHYDPNYEIGSNAECSEPLCCRPGTKPSSPEAAAGYWGDYRSCNLPWHSVIDALNQIVTHHRDIDYIYFTGDIINYKWWQTSVPSNTADLIKVYQQFKKSFGDLPVLPILGNHEPHPANQFSPSNITDPEINTNWLYKLAADQWSQWLPKETTKTISKGGYYTVKLKAGLRIIALNSNVCYTTNHWVHYNDVDPYEQLQWLVTVLTQAEIDKENVHILSHIPSGDTACAYNWINEFVKIIIRFSDIISAQFNGHTHYDDIVLFFKENTMDVINVAFNGGSLVPTSDLNPNYKVYYVDPISYNVLDYEVWTYNLTEANVGPLPIPNWYNLYNFTSQYNVSDLTLPSLINLVYEMALNPKSDLLQTYFRNKNRNAGPALEEGCDADCEIKNLCTMVTYLSSNDFHCKKITDMYNSVRPHRRN